MSAANVDESFVDKILNELLAEKFFANNPASCGDSLFIAENCLAEKGKSFTETYYKINRYYNTTEAEK